MDLGLRGKKALITGASKGIGRACAEALAEEGCDVALVSRTAADLDAARTAIASKHNVGVRVFALDLSDSRNVDKVAGECSDIDILVNNAGAIPGGNIDAIDEKRWREAWDLKVFGYINMTRRFYAQMPERLITLTKTRAKDRLGDENRWEELMKGHAFGRAAKPEEIAWMVAFVASDRSGYTTGNIITIDGGGSSRRSAL